MAKKRTRSKSTRRGSKRKSTGYSSAVNVRHSKRSRYGNEANVITSDRYVSRQARTDYALTLIDPFKKIPARIPDIASYETVCFTNEIHDHVSLLAESTATGDNNFLTVVNLSPGAWTKFYCGANFATDPGRKSTVSGWQPGGANTKTRYKSARLVSAVVKLTHADLDTNTAGEIIGGFLPGDYGVYDVGGSAGSMEWNGTVGAGLDANGNPDTLNYKVTTSTELKAILSNYYEGPIKNGVCIRYKPQDANSFDMKGCVADGEYQLQSFGCFLIAARPASTMRFNIDIVMNYEGILMSNDLGLIAGVSDADPGALAHGINAAAKVPSAFDASPASLHKYIDNVVKSVR